VVGSSDGRLLWSHASTNVDITVTKQENTSGEYDVTFGGAPITVSGSNPKVADAFVTASSINTGISHYGIIKCVATSAVPDPTDLRIHVLCDANGVQQDSNFEVIVVG
jgi:hypothetical protein